MFNENLDTRIRQHAFRFLDEINAIHGDFLPREVLARGFNFQGEQVHLLGPQGIFKPRILQLPLTITTAPNSPYDDDFSDDHFLRYKYRGTDPRHHENVGLRELKRRGVPLIYFHGTTPGSYVAHWPVFVVADMPEALTFGIRFDDRSQIRIHVMEDHGRSLVDLRRQYRTAEVKVRLHQQIFRDRVLHAYKHACALCRLRHSTLLDAAHIVPDSEERGEPKVRNGLSLCKLHHAAFDANILGIRPDLIAEIREDILDEIDGPMLEHGLKEMHNTLIHTPRSESQKPDPMLLEERYERFRSAPNRI
jgi:putative restriction endonuclease